MIRIVTDSTCDLADEHYSKYDITVVPINIQFGTETYLDVITIDSETFYRKIEESGTLPKTSQPSAGQFEEYYARLADEGATDIISIHVTGKLSGTVQSAEMAKEMVADRVRVHPFDTLNGSAGAATAKEQLAGGKRLSCMVFRGARGLQPHDKEARSDEGSEKEGTGCCLAPRETERAWAHRFLFLGLLPHGPVMASCW